MACLVGRGYSDRKCHRTESRIARDRLVRRRTGAEGMKNMCCGRESMRLAGELQSRRTTNAPLPPPSPTTRVAFEYAGPTGLTVVGPVTGLRYRFDGPGSLVDVDVRDRILLASIRQLRQVGSPKTT